MNEREDKSNSDVVGVAFDGHFGALHRPISGPLKATTVLICPPVGRDGRWSYRALFVFAQMLASHGFSVIRYDNRGEGDSLDVDPCEDQWSLWVEGLKQAAKFARSVAPSNRLFVAGLRIGATLAAATSADVKPNGLILFDPIPSGDAWLRELRRASAMLAAPPAEDGVIEMNGLRLSAATIASLESVDILLPSPSRPPVFLASPTAAKKLAAGLGSDVETAPFGGYAKLFKDAHVNEPPTQLFGDAIAWLDARSPDVSDRPTPAVPAAQIATPDWCERRVDFGHGLRGILCLPAQRNSSQAVIFGNTGGDPRSGIGTFGSRACRALASAGVGALRFDFSGLGESDDPPSGDPFHVYDTSRVDELRQAADVLRREGFDDLVLTGVCTGGFHAFRGVMEEAGFNRAVAINSWLIWRPGTALDRNAQVESMRAVYLRAPVQARKFLGVIRGGVRAAIVPRWLRFKRTYFPDAASRSARAEVIRASKRGARIHVVVGEVDRSREGLEDFGAQGRWLTKQAGFSISAVPDLDHALFSVDSQKMAIREIFEVLKLPAMSANPVRVVQAQSKNLMLAERVNAA